MKSALKTLVAIAVLAIAFGVLFLGLAGAQQAVDSAKIVQCVGGTSDTGLCTSGCGAQTPVASVTTCPFVSNVTSGNKELIFVAVASGTHGVASVSNARGTCSDVALASVTTQNPEIFAYTCSVTSTGAETITVTNTAGNDPTSTAIYEVSGTHLSDEITNAGFSLGAVTSQGGPLVAGAISQNYITFGALAVQGSHAATSGPGVPWTNSTMQGTSPSLYTAAVPTIELDPTTILAGPTYGWAVASQATGITVGLPFTNQATTFITGDNYVPHTVFGPITSFASGTGGAINLPTNVKYPAVIGVTCCTLGVMSSPTLTGGGPTYALARGPDNWAGAADSIATWLGFAASTATSPTVAFGVSTTGAACGSTAINGVSGRAKTDGTPAVATGNSAAPQTPADTGALVNDMALLPVCVAASGAAVLTATPLAVPGTFVAGSGGNLTLSGGYYPITKTGTMPAVTFGGTPSAQWVGQEVLIFDFVGPANLQGPTTIKGPVTIQ